MSWISLPDEIRAIRFLLDRRTSRAGEPDRPVAGDQLGLHRGAQRRGRRRDLPWLRVPAPVLRLGMGEASAELLTSARVVPARLRADTSSAIPLAAALAAALPVR